MSQNGNIIKPATDFELFYNKQKDFKSLQQNLINSKIDMRNDIDNSFTFKKKFNNKGKYLKDVMELYNP